MDKCRNSTYFTPKSPKVDFGPGANLMLFPFTNDLFKVSYFRAIVSN
jgi:hypothetical protein